MFRHLIVVTAVVVWSIVAPGVSKAELINNGDGTITQVRADDTALMWMQDANVVGTMNWQEAVDWAESLIFAGYDDWRLPCHGCSPREMKNLFDVEGISATTPVPFFNVQSQIYWYGTEFAGNTSLAWVMDFGSSVEAAIPKHVAFAWAVRDISVVPALFCNGFLPPFDGPLALRKKVKRAIPVAMQLSDTAGIIIDQDIMAAPVIQVTYSASSSTIGGLVDEGDLEAVGAANDDNQFRFDPDTGEWIFNLGTKNFTAKGFYTVSAVSGDDSEYTLNPTCSETFERLD